MYCSISLFFRLNYTDSCFVFTLLKIIFNSVCLFVLRVFPLILQLLYTDINLSFDHLYVSFEALKCGINTTLNACDSSFSISLPIESESYKEDCPFGLSLHRTACYPISFLGLFTPPTFHTIYLSFLHFIVF